MISITMEGGLITGIYSDDKILVGKEVVVVDYDAEGSDDSVLDKAGNPCLPHVRLVESATTEELQDDVDLAAYRAKTVIDTSETNWRRWVAEGDTVLGYHEWVTWREAGNGED